MMKTKLGQIITKSQKQKLSSLQNSQSKSKNNNKNNFHVHSYESINIVSTARNHQLYHANINKKQTESLYIQNYRLIESNFKLVNQMVGLVDFVKKYLLSAVRFIDEFKYFQTTKIIHQILKKIEQYERKGSEFGLNLSFNQFSTQNNELQKREQLRSSSVTPYFNPESADRIQISAKMRPKAELQMREIKKIASQSLQFCRLADIKIKPTKIQPPISILGQNLFQKEQFCHSVDYIDPSPYYKKHNKNYSYHEPEIDFGFQRKQRSVQSQNIIGKVNKYDPSRFKLQGRENDLYQMLFIQACSFQQILQSPF